MIVRALCNHYTDRYRTEGEEFEHSGPLYEHIVPVDPVEADEPESENKPKPKRGRKQAAADGSDEA